MTSEVDICGVFVTPLLLWLLAALPVAALLRGLLRRYGAYRFIWHRPLFDLALLVIVLGGVSLLAGMGAMKGLAVLGRMAVTAVAVAVAAVIGWQFWDYYMNAPWTRDGRIRADVVQVAADVSGLVAEVQVTDNQPVRKGDLLFRIDPLRFQLALQQAEASVASKQAAVQEAVQETNRFRALTNLSVSEEQQQQRAATAEEAAAAYQQAVADRDLAKLNLARTEVRAPVSGLVTNFDLLPGNYIDAGHPVFALIDTGSTHVDAYFEETKLARIHPGDAARIHLMGESTMLDGHVQSIAGGIADRERQASGDLLANVNPTFSWVRLAQRIPVRITLDHVPAGVLLVTGRTATVEVLPAAAANRN